MSVQSTNDIKAKILELCSDDDYGSWELWWNASAEVPAQQIPELKDRFLNVVCELVSAGKLKAKSESKDGSITPTQFDREKLAREIDSAEDSDDSFFWFGSE